MDSTSGVHALSLDQWSRRSWANGVQTEQMRPLDTLLVRTRNTLYEITIVTPATGEVVVRGGQFFPTFTRATLAGSSLGGGCLKLRGIYVGFSMELQQGGQTTRTTRVRAITEAAAQPPH